MESISKAKGALGSHDHGAANTTGSTTDSPRRSSQYEERDQRNNSRHSLVWTEVFTNNCFSTRKASLVAHEILLARKIPNWRIESIRKLRQTKVYHPLSSSMDEFVGESCR